MLDLVRYSVTQCHRCEYSKPSH